MKKLEPIVRDFVSRLSFDDLRFLSLRFSDRLGSDLSEATEFLSKSSEMDRWLLTARNASEFYDMLDMVQVQVDRELYKRIPEVVQA